MEVQKQSQQTDLSYPPFLSASTCRWFSSRTPIPCYAGGTPWRRRSCRRRWFARSRTLSRCRTCRSRVEGEPVGKGRLGCCAMRKNFFLRIALRNLPFDVSRSRIWVYVKFTKREHYCETFFNIISVFLKKNVRYPVWTCRDPISLILETRW